MSSDFLLQVVSKPSIGKMNHVVALQEPKARESLLTASMREKQLKGSPSLPSLPIAENPSEALAEIASLSITPSASTPAALTVPVAVPPKGQPEPPSPNPLNPLALVNERTKFAIDEAKEEEEDLDDLDDVAAEDGLLDEVRTTQGFRRLIDQPSIRWTHSLKNMMRAYQPQKGMPRKV
jgi:hypothetical protein